MSKTPNLVALQNLFESRLEVDLDRLPTIANSNPGDNWLVRSFISELEREFANAKDRNDRIAVSQSEEAKVYVENETFENIRTGYHKLWAKLSSLLPESSLNGTSELNSSMSHQQCTSYSQLKLTKVDLPTFNGSYNDWMDFNNMFTAAVHNNMNMDPVVKLERLKRAVTGEAESLIKNLELNAANYTVARKLLTDRYQHTRRLVNSYLKKLFDLPPIKTETSKTLKEMLNTLNECRTALKQLNVDIGDYRLIFHLCRNLPQTFLTAWEESLGSSTELPNFSTFHTFLETRFRIMEMVEPSEKPSKSFHVNSNPPSKSKSKRINDKPSSAKQAPIRACIVCKANHRLGKCDSFLKLSQAERLQAVRANKSCINCLDSSHMIQTCWSNKNCRVCNKKHHTLLHRYLANNASSVSPEAPATHSFHVSSHEETGTLLGTAQLRAMNPRGHSITIRALIDPCSEDSYILASTAQTLHLKRYFAPSTIGVLGEENSSECTHRVDLTLKSMDNAFNTTISAGVVEKITSNLPSVHLSTEVFGHFNDLPLADGTFNEPGRIHMLLGVDIHTKIRLDQSHRLGSNLIAENTLLGYIIRGKASTLSSSSSTVFMTKSSSSQLSAQIQKFWEIEELNTSAPLHPDEALCEQIFRSTIHRDSDGFLSMDLPFKDDTCPDLGVSRPMALKRFLSLEKKLNANPTLREEYHKTIRNYLSANHLQKAQGTDQTAQQYYLPHHAVLKESSSTTKLRVVFDASCRTFDGTSLNDHLLTGPKLQRDIRDVLFNWRQYPFALTADIEKMYLMFKINPKHHNYQKIVWRFSNDHPVEDFVLTRATFGTSCAPFLAIRSLHHIADLHEKSHPKVSKALRTEFYVDDFLSGGFSAEEALQKQTAIRTVLQDYHLILRKWSSNDPQTLSNVPEAILEPSNELVFDESEFKKTLGIYWSRDKDAFFFSITPFREHNSQFTKRQILSLIARLYDPLGWVSPCTMLAKQLMQKVWQTKADWDDVVGELISSQFTTFLNELPLLRNLSIPRWTNLMDSHSPLTVLGFCDASDKGYSAVVYLLNPALPNHTASLSLLTSKTKVADLKFQSTARLELNGAVLLSELLKWSVDMYQPREIKVLAFCDSKIVLAWLQGHPSKWKTYIANRTTQILDWMQPSQWHYVDTKVNPADCASRGLLPSELVNHSLWLNGPSLDDLSYEKVTTLNEDQKHIFDDSIKKTSLVLHARNIPNNDLLIRYSNHGKLIRIVNNITIFVKNTLCQVIKTFQKSTSKESEIKRLNLIISRLENPEFVVFRTLQQQYYSEEMKCLNSHKDLPQNSKLRGLVPFIDGNGVLRVSGRLQNSELSFSQQHPIILPSKHQSVTNLIADAHERTKHGSELLTLAYLRQRYHIPRASEKVRQFIHACRKCFRFSKQNQEFLMGSLPKDRVTFARAFQHSGVDYAGPITVKAYGGRCKKFLKSYVALFICLCTKAIHLELVSDLSSQAFLAAFKRFVGRRGRCHRMYSDNGTNFVGANKILQNDIVIAEQSWKSDLDIKFQELGTEWHFIPPATPHFGGLWEAGVKSIKTHLKKTVGNTLLTFEELCTVLIQIEAVLNSRPLCPISNNPDEFNFLTPAHFLIGEPLVAPPERQYDIECKSHLQRWNHVQLAVQRFAKLWKRDYLHNLLNRPKGLKTNTHYMVGDLVLLAEDNVPSTSWPTMIIDEVYPGNDGTVRVVNLRSPSGKLYKRPVTKLRRLPCNPSTEL